MSQLNTKNIGVNQIDDTLIRLHNNTALRARNAANSADVNVIKVNASDKPEFTVTPQCANAPSAGNDLVNKTYADGLTSGATVTLNNLTTTSINADLLPSANGARSFGSASLAWLTAFIQSLKDASSVIVLDVTNRILKNAAGTTVLDFSGTDLNVSTRKITNVVDPSSAQDAATKAYVDATASAQKTWGQEALTLNGTDITNQYVDLAQVAITNSIDLHFAGLWQRPTTDYTISYTGGAGGVTRISFAGDLATGGGSALVSSDIIYFKYQY